MTYYKLLDPHGEPANGGCGTWPLPRRSRPGKWTRRITDLVPCARGYHVLTADQVLGGWAGSELWRVEVRGEVIECDDKVVVESARLIDRIEAWTPRNLALLAGVFAARVLPVFEAARPGDDRPRAALRMVLDNAVRTAAADAAYAAAYAAARTAARTAAAAYAAARTAADAAADAAARTAAAADAAYAAARTAAAADAAYAASAATAAAADAAYAASAATAAVRAADATAAADAHAEERAFQRRLVARLLTGTAADVEAYLSGLLREALR